MKTKQTKNISETESKTKTKKSKRKSHWQTAYE